MTELHNDGNGEEPRVIVRDRRKIDPETGEVRREAAEEARPAGEQNQQAGRPEGSAPASAPADEGGGAADLQKQLEERTADLQRVTADFANYRKRVERDRAAVVAAAKASVLNELLPLLDDLERAEAHGDLTGPFKAVADKLHGTLQSVGLESFGSEGDTFDPMVHEAVQHSTSPDVTEPTVTTVLRRGYRFGDRVLRHAMVAVTDHEPAPQEEPSAAQPEAGGEQTEQPPSTEN
ncbi:nucleotide exchange factor GrpE [Thermocrispum municipale]|uniref:nucleotide exchange factor GrpE n=1 Tax=Thermocrispum municipale TaxID=37926 RepID=UPI00040FE29A|nr:nucleotide exchange factor GrpE [Thermocrispum municipale]